MKKSLLVVLLFTAIRSNAQENIVKLNLSGFVLGNIGVQYERTLNSHSSLAMGISFFPSSSLPKVLTDEDSTGKLASVKFSGWAFTPEYRYYLSGKGPKGFYLAPYFRYSTYSASDVTMTYTSSTTGEDQEVIGDGTFKGSTVGLMIGSQWLLGEHFTLDWWILGAGFGSQKAEIVALGSFSPTDVQDIKNELADVDVPGEFTYNVNSNSVYIKYDPERPGLRGFGLCFGYKF